VSEFAVADVVTLALREAIQEDTSMTCSKGCQNTKPLAAALTFAWDALLDETGTQVGVDKATARTLGGLTKALVLDPIPARKPRKLSCCVDAQVQVSPDHIYHP
jgi:hypothetical protein